jgi:hypothetical protein
MTEKIRPRDWEALSAYLDGRLSPRERARLEARLQASADLRTALDELRRTRAVLRAAGKVRAPRSFTLTPAMLGEVSRTSPAFGLFSAMRLTAVLATALFLLVLVGDLLSGVGLGRRELAALPAPVETMAVQVAPEEAPPPVETPSGAGTTEALPLEASKMQELSPTLTVKMPFSATEAGVTQALEVEKASPAIPSTPEEVGALSLAPAMTPTVETFEPLPFTSTPPPPESQPPSRFETQGAGPGPWSLWRILEVILAVIGVTSGLVAYSLARAGRK